MSENKTKTAYLISTVAVIGFFILSAVIVIYAGLLVYRNIAIDNLKTYELRTSLLYVSTKVNQNDCINDIAIREISGTPVLSLIETVDDEDYETAIYHYDGVLYEYYHEADSEFELENGFEISKIGDFRFSLSNDLLTITSVSSDGESESLNVYINTAN